MIRISILWIRSLLFYAFLWLWTAIWGMGAAPFFFFFRRFRKYFLPIWSKVLLVALEYICAIKVRVLGKENIPMDGPFLLAAKHQSTLETIFFPSIVPRISFIIKRELTRIPIFGWYLRYLHFIIINRTASYTALRQVIDGVGDCIKNKRTIIIFPEGTRVSPEKRVACKSGVFAIKKTYPDIKVIPVTLDSGCFWNNESLLKIPGTVTVRFLSPLIDIKHDKNTFLTQLGNAINFSTGIRS